MTDQQRRAAQTAPETRQRHRERTTALWADPEYRARQKAGVRQALSSPEYKQHARDRAKARWADPDYKARMLAARSAPETRERIASGQRARWAAKRGAASVLEVTPPAPSPAPARIQPDAQAGQTDFQSASDVDGIPVLPVRRRRRPRWEDEQRRINLANARASRQGMKAKMRDGLIQMDTVLRYTCRYGHTWEYHRAAGTRWSETSEPCYGRCSNWDIRYFPSEHPTRAGEVEHRDAKVGTVAQGRS